MREIEIREIHREMGGKRKREIEKERERNRERGKRESERDKEGRIESGLPLEYLNCKNAILSLVCYNLEIKKKLFSMVSA